MISPVIGLFANTDLSYLVLTVGEVEIRYGAFLTAVINFVIMAAIIFMLVKGMNTLANIGKKKEAEAVVKAPSVKQCPYCKSEIAVDALRCPHCTSILEE